jgi:hypothetical protein
MDINDVPDSGQLMALAKKLLAKNPAKRKAKVLPDELLVIVDCPANHAKFIIMTEPNPHKNSTTYSQDCKVIAKYKMTATDDKVVLLDLTTLTVDQIRMLFGSIGVTN